MVAEYELDEAAGETGGRAKKNRVGAHRLSHTGPDKAYLSCDR